MLVLGIGETADERNFEIMSGFVLFCFVLFVGRRYRGSQSLNVGRRNQSSWAAQSIIVGGET
jgi:hypothetical protein